MTWNNLLRHPGALRAEGRIAGVRIFGDVLSPACWSVRTRVTAAATVLVGLLLVVGVVLFYQVVRSTVFDGLHNQGSLVVADLGTLVRETDPRGTLHVQDPDFTLLQVVDGEGACSRRASRCPGAGR